MICAGNGASPSSTNSAPANKKRIRLYSIHLQINIRRPLKGHRQFFRPRLQWFRQRCQRRFNFRRRHHAQIFPTAFHELFMRLLFDFPDVRALTEKM
jgi:hypothetical protein